MAPYAFHPEYSTANPRGNTWSAHTYNVAMSDEIGHFENCLKLDANLNCVKPGAQDKGGLDEDDGNNFCVPASDSTLIHINGCFSADGDFDGQSYQQDWPGTDPNVHRDRALHPSPVLFTSPLTNNGRTNYSTVAFETDLPRIEAPDSQDNPPFCDRTTGANCVNPPNGAQFYPFVLDADCERHLHVAGGRSVHSRHDQRLRRQLDSRVRPTAEDGLPAPGLHNAKSDSTTSTAETWRIRAGSASSLTSGRRS